MLQISEVRSRERNLCQSDSLISLVPFCCVDLYVLRWTYKLLEYHNPDANRNTLEHVHLEHWLPGAEAAMLSQLRLDFVVEHDCGLDLQELGLQDRIIRCKPSELGQGRQAVLVAVLHGKPSRAEWQEEHSNKEGPGEDELERQGEPPRDVLLARAQVTMRRVVVEGAVLEIPIGLRDSVGFALAATDKVHTIVEPESNGGTDGDGKLLQRDEPTAELRGRDLSLVERDHHGEHADSETPNDTAREEVVGLCRGELEAGAGGEDDDSDHHGVLARDGIGQPAAEEGTGPGAELEGGDEPALDGRAHQVRELGLEVLHDQDRGHDALVVAVHAAADAGEGAGHEDVRVLEHAHDAVLLVGGSAADGRLAGHSSSCDHLVFL